MNIIHANTLKHLLSLTIIVCNAAEYIIGVSTNKLRLVDFCTSVYSFAPSFVETNLSYSLLETVKSIHTPMRNTLPPINIPVIRCKKYMFICKSSYCILGKTGFRTDSFVIVICVYTTDKNNLFGYFIITYYVTYNLSKYS